MNVLNASVSCELSNKHQELHNVMSVYGLIFVTFRKAFQLFIFIPKCWLSVEFQPRKFKEYYTLPINLGLRYLLCCTDGQCCIDIRIFLQLNCVVRRCWFLTLRIIVKPHRSSMFEMKLIWKSKTFDYKCLGKCNGH